MVDGRGRPARDKKIENLIMNHSMIFMGIFEEAFSTLADRMTEALAIGTAAMAEALAQGSGARVAKKAKAELSPELRLQIGNLLSGIREEIASEWPKNATVFKKYISSSDFDKGIKIVEKYDFGRPRITEKLSDEVIASYIFLLESGDKDLREMFKQLSAWQASLPRPPWSP